MDEILIKSKDGKWHILKGEEILPYDSGELGTPHQNKFGAGQVMNQKLGITPPNPPLIKGGNGGGVLLAKGGNGGALSHEAHPLRTELDELIDNVMQNVELRMKNPAPEQVRYGAGVEWLEEPLLKKRFRMIVSARLRDVRDAIETRQMLIRPVKVGGMGLKDSMITLEHGNMVTLVDWVASVIEKAFEEFQTKWKEVERKRIDEWKKRQAEERERKQIEAEKKEKEELEKRYKQLTAEISNSKFLISNKIPKPKIQPRTTSGSGLPSTSHSAGQIPKPQVKLPPPLLTKSPQLSSPPSPLPEGEGRVRVGKFTDVRPAPRRIGHIEELGTITLDDLRRLPGSTAMEKVGKIGSKIEFLGQESLSQRAKGIAAWRQSPLSQMYNNTLKQAMSRRVGPETILKENPGSLTIDEFHGIMDLNRRLQY